MAFGSPGLSIVITNLAVALTGALLTIYSAGACRALGVAILCFGLFLGFLMNSWAVLVLLLLRAVSFGTRGGPDNDKDPE